MEQLRSLEDLLELMEIDMKIDSLLDARAALPELDKYKAAHGEVERIQIAAAEATEQMEAANRSLHKTNGELEIAAVKAAEEQNRLYAGGLTAKDADYLRREVDMLYARLSKMEDEVLAYIETSETAEQTVSDLADEQVTATELKDQLAGSIKEQWDTIDKELAAKEERKKTTIGLVDPYLVEMYDELRETGMGRVVGRLTDDTCGSCHLRLSAAEAMQAKKQDPPRCIHCRAILVS